VKPAWAAIDPCWNGSPNTQSTKRSGSCCSATSASQRRPGKDAVKNTMLATVPEARNTPSCTATAMLRRSVRLAIASAMAE